tara:strand:- start:1310 stop:2440 length:1131 start_codon:yes stop_codon:yes gene_type:complete
MHYFEFPTKDTTLYEGEATSSQNTGLDEILEIRKKMNDSGTQINVSRILIQFDLTFISKSISSGLIPTDADYYLNLYDAGSQELGSSDVIYAYPVSQSWENGEGKFDYFPIVTDGASWRYRTGPTANDQWVAGTNDTGGTWFKGTTGQYTLEASQSFTNEASDVRMNVTGIVNNWISSGSVYPNEGFMVKRSGSVGNSDVSQSEGNTTRFGDFKFFSRETHTIYPPKLEVVWNNANWETGSLQPITGSDLHSVEVYMQDLRKQYQEDSKVRFRVFGRERFPTKTWSSTTSNDVTVKYLPSGSTYYEVKDAFTEDVIIPFGSGSIIGCDSRGNYFDVWLQGFQPERDYRINYKIVSGSGIGEVVHVIDNDFQFRVIR